MGRSKRFFNQPHQIEEPLGSFFDLVHLLERCSTEMSQVAQVKNSLGTPYPGQCFQRRNGLNKAPVPGGTGRSELLSIEEKIFLDFFMTS